MINNIFSIKLVFGVILFTLISGTVEPKQNDTGDSQITPVIIVRPNYPQEAALNKLEGYVNIQFTINETGSVENPQIIESVPEGVFDTEAIKAILKYKFLPAKVKNKTVKQKASQIIEFKLSSSNHLQEDTTVNKDKEPFYNYDLNYSTKKDKKYYRHVLTIRDKNTNNIIKEMELPRSYKRKGDLLRRGNSEFLFYYYETNNGQGRVEIISMDSLKFIHKINTDKLTVTKEKKRDSRFYMVTADTRHLLLQVGKGVDQRIINIDAASGQVVKEVAIGKSKTLIKTNSRYDYIWARSVNKKSGNTFNIFKADSLEKVNTIKIEGKFSSLLTSNDQVYLIEKHVDIKHPENNKYRVKIINLKNNRVFDQYTSSTLPKLQTVDGKILYLIGRSLEKSKYLKIVKFENETFTDLSNTTIDMVVEDFNTTLTDNEQIIVLFGKKSVVRFDLLNPNNSSYIATPFKIEGGIVSKDTKKVYVIANFGAKIGLADFNENRFVGSEHTGSKGKKIGKALAGLLTMAVTAPTGYMLIPGVKLSKNALMLSKNQKFLFALNSKTNDVTVFNANDLSNKKIYPTGRSTFQIIQAGHQVDLPVVVVSQKQATYFDASTGEQVFVLKYDNFVKITDELTLIYQEDKTNKVVSLYEVPVS